MIILYNALEIKEDRDLLMRRYRNGDCCLMTFMKEDRHIITLIEIGHGKDVYKH